MDLWTVRSLQLALARVTFSVINPHQRPPRAATIPPHVEHVAHPECVGSLDRRSGSGCVIPSISSSKRVGVSVTR